MKSRAIMPIAPRRTAPISPANKLSIVVTLAHVPGCNKQFDVDMDAWTGKVSMQILHQH
jgi:hypothetical protein